MAIAGGVHIENVASAIRIEADPIARVALIERLDAAADDATQVVLLEALDDDAWQVRSRVASALARAATLERCSQRSPFRDALVVVLARGREPAPVAAAEARQQLGVVSATASV